MGYFRRVFILVLVGSVLVAFIGTLVSNQYTMKSQRHHPWGVEPPVLIQAPVIASASVLVCVASEARNLPRRQAIRETWGSTRSLRVIFFIGLPQGSRRDLHQKLIDAESKSFGDLVQAEFDDKYRNLTLKSIAIIQWATRSRWPGRRFVVKTDDDVFVNTPLLFLYMDHFTNGDLYGNCRHRAPVYRCKSSGCSKYGLTKKEFYPDVYPPYLLGLFYVFTERALDRLSKHLFEPQFLFIEDVYITGLVAARAGVPRYNMPDGIKVNPWKLANNTAQNLLNKGLMAQHISDPALHREYWNYVRSRLPYKL